MKKKLRIALSFIIVFSTLSVAVAQDVTLRVHHFMSEKSNLHRFMLMPLAERLAIRSGGRFKLELYASMSLGGRPGDLYDQAVDGAVDIILTLPGYTAGRFPRSEVFELPFIMEDHIATTEAFWDLIEQDFQHNEYEDTKVLTAWMHGPGLLHSKKPITRLEDLRGMEVRGATRLVTNLIGELGGIPVGMPLPTIPESLSKGVISGAALPWEITTSIKIPELVENHTEFAGGRALYTAALILVMNWDAYDNLPADLRTILDEETGKILAVEVAKMLQEQDQVAMKKAIAANNNLITLDEAEVVRWIDSAQPVYTDWIKSTGKKGFDGQKLLEKAKMFIQVNRD